MDDAAVVGRPEDAAHALRGLVEQYRPVDERSERSRSRFLQLLDEIPLPLSRDRDPRHVTASAVVVSPLGVLLHLHKRAALWTGPGGHVDDGEVPGDAVVREAFEETGLIVRHPEDGPVLVHIDVHDAGAHVHYDLRYLLFADAVAPVPPEGESQDVEWLAPEEAKARADRSYRAAIAAAEALPAFAQGYGD